MADHTTDHTHTYVERETRSGGGAMGFILGAVVVVRLILGFVLFGGDVTTSSGAGDAVPANGDSVSVTITEEGDAGAAANTESAPAATESTGGTETAPAAD